MKRAVCAKCRTEFTPLARRWKRNALAVRIRTSTKWKKRRRFCSQLCADAFVCWYLIQHPEATCAE